MITVSQIREKAASRYESSLKKLLLGDNPFPVRVPYKRPPRTGDPSVILKVKEMLRSQSKEAVGFGPSVNFEESNTRRFGRGALPGAVTFDTLDDLTRYIGKKAEADRVLAHAQIVTDRFPQARSWTATRLRMLASDDTAIWRGIVQTVDFFIQNPKPWVYPRELHLGLPTKFLEHNYSPVIEILAHVSPSSLSETYTTWQDRLGLRSSSDLIEGRFLDSALAPHLPQHMIAPIAEWNRCMFPNPAWVLITENRTTLLGLPHLPGCLALLGKGYAVTRLAQIEKLQVDRLIYWGDIDQHGFEILASLRSHIPNVKSCLMDEPTLAHCEQQVRSENVSPTLSHDFVAMNLNSAERALWEKCLTKHLRLEQEQIPQHFSFKLLADVAKSFIQSD